MDTIQVNPVPEAAPESRSEKLTMDYILAQIERVATQTEHLNLALEKLVNMSDGENGESYSPGNLQGKAKAEAIAGVVRSREETNQRLLSLYTMMYADLRRKPASLQEKALEMIGRKLEGPIANEAEAYGIGRALDAILQRKAGSGADSD